MAWGSRGTAFKGYIKLPRLLKQFLIIHSDNAIISCTDKLCTIVVVIATEQLRQLIKDGVEAFARCHVPMLKGTVCINRDEDTFSDSGTVQGSPFKRNHRHFLFHLRVQSERWLASEHVVDADSSIKGALS